MAILRILLVLFVTSAQVHAGAWARGAGNTFVALSYAMSEDPAHLGTDAFDPDGYTSVMIERGAGDRFTFGMEAGLADTGDYKAVAYFSRVFGPIDGTTKFALHLGGGMSRHFAGDDPLIYAGTSLGRGLTTPWGSGWAALDTTLYYRTATDAVIAKADATFGVNASDRLKLFVQFQAGKYPDNDPYLRVVPTAAYRVGSKHHLELGVSVGVAGDSRVGLKLGTWMAF